MTKKYTLDRIDNDLYVFLEFPEEDNQLLIPIDRYDGKLAEGEIVLIEGDQIVKVLDQETKDMKDKVSNLLERLKNKNV